MDQTTLLYVMTAFVIISAIALCIQAGMLAALYKKTKSLQEKIEPLVPKVDALVESTKTTIDQTRKQILEITTRTNEILESTKEQLAIVGPKGRIERVRVLGPARKATQVEIAMTEQFKLGIQPPIRESGDIDGSPGCTLESTAGSSARHAPRGRCAAAAHSR